jgi:acetylornithine/N-succinyldiaminopimelate aminotransferase
MSAPGREPTTVLKLGGELLESPAHLRTVTAAVSRLAGAGPLVIVHGGGREIDAALAAKDIGTQAIDGLRVTDEETLATVVAVLAGTVNTRLVASLVAAGIRAVGLTGADAAALAVRRADPHRRADGTLVDLGLVGEPVVTTAPPLLVHLLAGGYVPVMACLGIGAGGVIHNVNADTAAATLAGRLGAASLIVAGGTAGVLDESNATIPALDPAGVDAIIQTGGATAGMIAKLRACADALRHGVEHVVIVDGRELPNIETRRGTRIVRGGAESQADRSSTDPVTARQAGLRSGRALSHTGSRHGGARREAGDVEHARLQTADTIRAREAAHLVQSYRRAPIVFVRGEGAHLYDAGGTQYLDLISGIGVASLGHANPALAAAIAEQSRTLVHTSNLYFHELQGRLAERLSALSGLARAFFCNSGAEAVEACLKFARKYWHARGENGRTGLVALEHGFHGRTLGALSVTWEPHYRAPFGPLLPEVTFVPPDDPEALRSAVSNTTAAIIYEPIQGEGGVRPLTPGFGAALAEARTRTGALLIADEVQSGLGRTGHPFYSSLLGLTPDLLAVGKALGGGVPIGAALASDDVARTIAFGDHGSTYGGNLLACRAALVFLDHLEAPGFLTRIADLGQQIEQRLRRTARAQPVVSQVRGAGLMWGVELRVDATPVVEAARRQRVLINRTAERVVRLLPPLTIGWSELDQGLAILDAALAELGHGVAV